MQICHCQCQRNKKKSKKNQKKKKVGRKHNTSRNTDRMPNKVANNYDWKVSNTIKNGPPKKRGRKPANKGFGEKNKYSGTAVQDPEEEDSDEWGSEATSQEAHVTTHSDRTDGGKLVAA